MFKELQLVLFVLKKKQGAVEALTIHLTNRKKYFRKVSGRNYRAAWGGIRVCADIYGYEVMLGWNPLAELLDSYPSYYGLTDEQAKALYTAILTCIPTSIYANKGAAC